MGICPRLPPGQLVVALLADRVRTAFGQAGAIVRVHPAGSALPAVAVSVGITSFLVLSALSVHIVHLPPQAARSGNVAGRSATGGTTQPLPSPGAGQPGARPAGSRPTGSGPSGGGPSGGRSPAGPGLVPTPSGAPITNPVTDPSQGTGGTGGGGTGTSPDPSSTPTPGGGTLTGPAATTPPPQDPSSPATVSSDPPSSPSPTPSTKPGGTGNQLCVDVGALGICIKV